MRESESESDAGQYSVSGIAEVADLEIGTILLRAVKESALSACCRIETHYWLVVRNMGLLADAQCHSGPLHDPSAYQNREGRRDSPSPMIHLKAP